MRALGDIFLIKRGGEAESGATAGAGFSLVDIVLRRLAIGELGPEGGWCGGGGRGTDGGVLDILRACRTTQRVIESGTKRDIRRVRAQVDAFVLLGYAFRRREMLRKKGARDISAATRLQRDEC